MSQPVQATGQGRGPSAASDIEGVGRVLAETPRSVLPQGAEKAPSVRVIPSLHSPRAAHNLQQLDAETPVLNSKDLRVELLQSEARNLALKGCGRWPGRLPYSLGGMISVMSIYATLWTLKFPKEGDDFTGCDWIEVTAQGVPAHIGSKSPGAGYEGGDPFGAFLPPPVAVDSDGEAPHMRAVVFITELTQKGTERSGQEYQSPLLILTGEEYDKITFAALCERICSALRGNRAPVIAQITFPDGATEIIRHRPQRAE